MDCQRTPRQNTSRQAIQSLILWLGLLISPAVLAQPPIELYARLPELSNPRLSPDGEHFAVEMSYQGFRVLVVRDIYGKNPPSILRAGDLKIHDYEWVSNDRLVLHVRATGKVGTFLFNYTRLISIRRDGSDAVILQMRPNEDSFYAIGPHIVSRLPDDPDHVLAVLNDEYGRYGFPEVERVNVHTGKGKLVQSNVRDIVSWMADENGKLRAGYAVNYKGLGRRGRTATIYFRASEDSDWETVQQTDIRDGELMYPIGFDPDDGMVLLVSSNELAGTTLMQDDAAIYRYDMKSKRLLDQYENRELNAIADMAREQFGVARAYVTSRDDGDRRMIITTYSDINPPRYYLYERGANRLSPLGGQYPKLENSKLAPMQNVEYKARDGRMIPGFLTLPPGAEGKPPLLVYPHGGPWARDYWGFDNYVQFFASRGYAVFQPQFRGSTGFGTEHLEAGYGEWGMAIQDDITDGVQWLIAEGKVDPKKVCIYGASFGGYAAAMGAVKTPKLYRCAITENGVLDLKRMIKNDRRFAYADGRREMFNDLDNAEAASPYHLYKQIEIPVLVIASDKDTVVPWADHSKRFYKRVKKLDVESDLVVLEGGEHWRTNEAHELRKMEAIIGFLDRHIGN